MPCHSGVEVGSMYEVLLQPAGSAMRRLTAPHCKRRICACQIKTRIFTPSDSGDYLDGSKNA